MKETAVAAPAPLPPEPPPMTPTTTPTLPTPPTLPADARVVTKETAACSRVQLLADNRLRRRRRCRCCRCRCCRCRRSPFTAHRSPLTAHRSPLTADADITPSPSPPRVRGTNSDQARTPKVGARIDTTQRNTRRNVLHAQASERANAATTPLRRNSRPVRSHRFRTTTTYLCSCGKPSRCAGCTWTEDPLLGTHVHKTTPSPPRNGG